MHEKYTRLWSSRHAGLPVSRRARHRRRGLSREGSLLSWNDPSIEGGAEAFANLPQMQEAHQREEILEAPETVWRQPQELEPRTRPSRELLHENLTPL